MATPRTSQRPTEVQTLYGVPVDRIEELSIGGVWWKLQPHTLTLSAPEGYEEDPVWIWATFGWRNSNGRKQTVPISSIRGVVHAPGA